MQCYESYKPSEAAWLGNVPSHWDVQPLRAVTSLKSDKNRPDLPVLSVYREFGVILKDSRDDNHNATSLDTTTYKVVKPGDLVVNKMKAWQGSMGVSAHNGIVSPAYITCTTKADRVRPAYLHYLLRSSPLIGVYNSLSYGVRVGQWDMHYEDFKQIPIPLPPKDEQDRIVAFLDQKTVEIDAAIAKKERLIELLGEQKRILINKTVTRGLNRSVEMKQSGIAWLGNIPAHWKLLPNKALFRERKELGKPELPILSVSLHSGVSDQEQDETENIRAKIRIEDKTSYKRVFPGDVAYNMMRAWQGAIGVVRVDGLVSPAYVVAAPRSEIHGGYFEYLYRTEGFIREMDRFSKGITDFRKRLYWDEFKQLMTLLPPVAEQIAIAEHVERIGHKTAQACANVLAELEKLQELRRVLVAKTVTGQVSV
jgi:type I restriction enzyme S subunit